MNKIIDSVFISMDGMAEDALEEGNQSRAALLKTCERILRDEIDGLLKIESAMIALRRMYNRNSLAAYSDDTDELAKLMISNAAGDEAIQLKAKTI